MRLLWFAVIPSCAKSIYDIIVKYIKERWWEAWIYLFLRPAEWSSAIVNVSRASHIIMNLHRITAPFCRQNAPVLGMYRIVASILIIVNASCHAIKPPDYRSFRTASPGVFKPRAFLRLRPKINIKEQHKMTKYLKTVQLSALEKLNGGILRLMPHMPIPTVREKAPLWSCFPACICPAPVISLCRK